MSRLQAVTIVPLGWDAKSAKAVKEAFEAGRDFLIMDYSHEGDGRRCNKADLLKYSPNVGIARIRYKQKREVTSIKIVAKEKADESGKPE